MQSFISKEAPCTNVKHAALVAGWKKIHTLPLVYRDCCSIKYLFMENKLIQCFLKTLNSCFVLSAWSGAFSNMVHSVCILPPGVIASLEANFKAVFGSQPWLALWRIRFWGFFVFFWIRKNHHLLWSWEAERCIRGNLVLPPPVSPVAAIGYGPLLHSPVLNWCARLLCVLKQLPGLQRTAASQGCVKWAWYPRRLSTSTLGSMMRSSVQVGIICSELKILFWLLLV